MRYLINVSYPCLFPDHVIAVIAVSIIRVLGTSKRTSLYTPEGRPHREG